MNVLVAFNIKPLLILSVGFTSFPAIAFPSHMTVPYQD